MYTIILTVCHREGDHRIEITKQFSAFDHLATFYRSIADALADSDAFILKFEVTPDPVKPYVATNEAVATTAVLPGPYTGQDRP